MQQVTLKQVTQSYFVKISQFLRVTIGVFLHTHMLVVALSAFVMWAAVCNSWQKFK